MNLRRRDETTTCPPRAVPWFRGAELEEQEFIGFDERGRDEAGSDRRRNSIAATFEWLTGIRRCFEGGCF